MHRAPQTPVRNARRAGWVGCNIVLKQLPPEGRISIIRDERGVSPATVRKEYERFRFLSAARLESRGWTADILRTVREIGDKEFTLNDIYAREDELAGLHPLNKHVRPKIRQQLQVLRDKGVLEFLGGGRYRLR